QDKFKDPQFCHWFLVTSVEQDKMDEMVFLKKELQSLIHDQYYLVVNKTITSSLADWTPPKDNKELLQLKKSMLFRERKINGFLKEHFSKNVSFPEIFSQTAEEHVCELATYWP
ncbi:MAG: hypothetical protein WCG27_11030, partial [Pseudomonadota bacterium]